MQDTDAIIAQRKLDGRQQQDVPQSSYWAACDSSEIAQELKAKVDEYHAYIVSSNLVELWRRSYRAYYGMRQSTGTSGWGVFAVGQLIASGDQGEIAKIKVNHYANLITHQYVMTTSQRPALECRAINSDADSLVSAQVGDGVVEYYMRERKIERNYFTGVETGIVIGEAYAVLGWDPQAGKQYGRGPNGAILYDGDLIASNFTPFQVTKDINKNSDDEQTWYITHSSRNKYDLMAKHPQYAADLERVPSDMMTQANRTYSDPSKIIMATNTGAKESDDIPYFEFYHKKTAAMPNGRYTIFVDGDVCLFDGPLPFREVPVYRLAPRNIIGTPFGWTAAFDILALQELVDKLYTAVATNNLTSAISNFWAPPGADVLPSQLAGGNTLIQSVVKPEVLNLLQTPAEAYAFIKQVEQVMETLMGVSGINRGDLPSNDLSGSAMAFMASQAITFSSGLQASANQLLESMGTGMINILKDYAKTPRIATIAGKQNRPQMLQWDGSKLEQINNVVCDATSALSKTTAGKISIADNLLKAGMLANSEEYLTLIKTGQNEPLTRAPVMENFLIQSENEELLQGINPPVLRIDKHAQHIAEHKTILSTPASRRDPRIVDPTLQHIKDHEDAAQMMQQTDPAFLAATHQPPLPFPPPPQAGPPPGAAPAGPGGPPGAPAGVPGTLNPASPAAQQAAKVRQPNMPSLPKGADQQTQSAYAQMKGA